MNVNGVEYLVGEQELLNQPIQTFSQEAIDFLSSLSSTLMKMPESRAYPDLMAVAFWCRKGNLLKHKAMYTDATIRLGRGLAFHIAPSNIPMNFAFSWFFSLLAGNANIVRLPSKRFPQVSVFCSVVEQLLSEYPEIQKRTAFVSYPADDKITAMFCANADARVIWGGDSTIALVRQLPTKPRCVDLTFADRYSICVLNGEAILAGDGQELKKLAERFYNDTYLMDQNACSSPQLIFWINGIPDAKERFWNAVEITAAQKYELQGMTAVDKYTQLCQDALERPVQKAICQNGNLLYRVQLSSLPKENSTSLRGKGGYFYEYDLPELKDLCGLVNEKYQTVTYYGIQTEELQQLVITNQLRGIDRIVPVGSAMDIDIIWDGYDIVRMLSRIVQAG